MNRTVVIIGSGFGGLAAAALLAKDGYSVTVLEKNESLGGRASVFEADGFRFDMGPSWYLMPDVFKRFFAEFGKKPADFYTLVPLEPQYRTYFADGTMYDILKDPEVTITYFESVEPGAGKKLRKYLREAQQKYEIAINHYLYKNIDGPIDFWTPELLNLRLSLSMAQSMKSVVYPQFKNPKLRALLTYALLFMGCSPKNAPALFTLMSHVDFTENVFYPMGGMSAVVKAMVQIGKSLGVKYVMDEPVTRLRINNARVTKVETDNSVYTADIVISNADYAHTESLFSDENCRSYSAEYWKQKTFSPSTFLMYLGVKKKLPEIMHHTFIFSEEYDKHYEQVFETKQWPDNPSLYINKPSAIDPNVAPKGHENLMILVPIAAGLNETEALKKEYAQYIYKYIEKRIGISLQKHVVYERLFSGIDFVERYNAYGGNAFAGLANTFFQSTFFRQSNKHKKVNNLYFVGCNTQPGIGVPPAIISAHLIRDRLQKLK